MISLELFLQRVTKVTLSLETWFKLAQSFMRSCQIKQIDAGQSMTLNDPNSSGELKQLELIQIECQALFSCYEGVATCDFQQCGI